MAYRRWNNTNPRAQSNYQRTSNAVYVEPTKEEAAGQQRMIDKLIENTFDHLEPDDWQISASCASQYIRFNRLSVAQWNIVADKCEKIDASLNASKARADAAKHVANVPRKPVSNSVKSTRGRK